MLILTPNSQSIAKTHWGFYAPWRRKLKAEGKVGHKWPFILPVRKSDNHAPGMLSLFYFRTEEFDHPQMMDMDFLLQLDYFRHICGFPISVRDDARTQEEHEALYSSEIESGAWWPRSSAHLIRTSGAVKAVDLRARPHGAAQRATMTMVTLRFHELGIWPNMGLIIETGHHHIDNMDSPKRPFFDIGVSR